MYAYNGCGVPPHPHVTAHRGEDLGVQIVHSQDAQTMGRGAMLGGGGGGGGDVAATAVVVVVSGVVITPLRGRVVIPVHL